MVQGTDTVSGEERGNGPVGTVNVVDSHPLNWLYITYNTVEEPVRVSPDGIVEPAAMSDFRWTDGCTLEIDVREGEVFPDGQPLTARRASRAFDEVMRWASPHPPGTQFNLALDTTLEVTGEHRVRLHFPEPDGPALGKLRAMHVMSASSRGIPGIDRTNSERRSQWRTRRTARSCTRTP